MIDMSNESVSIEELTKKRTPSELLTWVRLKMDQIESTDEGERALRLREGLAKQLMEEVYPLAIFGWHKFGNTDQILIHPIIGNQSYDAVVTDLRSKPASQSYVEITQSHEGESDYLRRLVLQKQGIVFMHGPVIKTGTKKTGRLVSTPVKVVTPNEVARNELGKIVDAAKRKEAKDYPASTSLVIVINDDLFFQKAINNAKLDAFVKKDVLNLDLRFSTLYLVGWQESIFREFSLCKA
jgi:hypothetical protein